MQADNPKKPPTLADSIEAVARQKSNTIEAQRPEVAARALDLLANGSGPREVVRETGIGISAITRLRRDHGELLAAERRKAAERAERTAELAREVAEKKLRNALEDDQEAAKLHLRDAAVSYGIFTDKALRLRDVPDVTVKHEHEFTLKDAADWLEKARAARGRVVE